MLKRSLALCLTTGLLLAHAATPGAAPQVGPLDLQGSLNGAPYRIKVPAVWNGTLLVSVHGYRDKADHPGEVDDRTADASPAPALEPLLLAQGYALAGSAFRDNGWAMEEGLQDTKDLVVFFRETVAKPDRTIIVGVSFGTVIAYESLTRFSGVYDGGIAACGVGAGATRTWDGAADLWIAYSTVFGALPAWGSAADVRDDLDFETEILPKLLSEIASPTNFARFEFLRLVLGTPGAGLTPPPPPFFYPGWVVTAMFYATEARAELERRAGGPIVETVGHHYSLTSQEKSYLALIDLPTPQVDALLASMNAQPEIVAPNASRNYVAHNADYNGNFKRPLLSVHTIIDGLLPVSHQAALRETVRPNRLGNLFQTYTTGSGHCSFTGPQMFTLVVAIDAWVRTGVRPTVLQFPAALGFAPTFVPPPFPQP